MLAPCSLSAAAAASRNSSSGNDSLAGTPRVKLIGSSVDILTPNAILWRGRFDKSGYGAATVGQSPVRAIGVDSVPFAFGFFESARGYDAAPFVVRFQRTRQG